MQKTFEAKEFSKVDINSNYATMKSFEIMSDAANNESDGSMGATLQAGIGLGAGLPLGQQMGQQMNAGQQESQQSVHEKLSNFISSISIYIRYFAYTFSNSVKT